MGKTKNTKKKSQTKQVKANTIAIGQLKHAPEIKFIISFIHTAGSVVNTLLLPLNLVQKGTGDQNRIGNYIKLIGYTIRTFVTANDLSVGGNYREIIFIDNQVDNNPVAPSDGELLEDASSLADGLVSTYNRKFTGKGRKFRILHDSGPVHLTPGARTFKSTNYTGRLGYKVNYSNNTNPPDISDIVNIGLWRMFISTSSNLTQSLHAMVTFTDN